MAEKHSYGKLANAIYEPVEWLRFQSRYFWVLTEKLYEKCGGRIFPGHRFYFNTPRRFIVFCEDGKKKIEREFSGGKRSSYTREWYSDGTLKSLIDYKDGELHGVAKGWHPNGALEYDTTYDHGKEKGDFSKYYDNSVLEYKYSYDKNNLLTGDAVWKDRKGNILAQGVHKNGEMWSGTFLIYKRLIIFYRDGVPYKVEDLQGNIVPTDKAEAIIKEELRKYEEKRNSLFWIFDEDELEK